MADRPIIFSSPMVRSLLEGRKTQTRRVAKFQPPKPDNVVEPLSWWSKIMVGDRLWVRESIDKMSTPEDITYKADWPGDPRGLGWRPSIHMPRWASRLTLTVTDVRIQRLQDITNKDAIAEGIKPHATQKNIWIDYPEGSSAAGWAIPVNSFISLWNSINGPGAWDENPWVAAYSFTVERRNIDEVAA